MKTLVLGIGNVLMQDDGLGPYAVNLLSERLADEEDITLIDGGTLGLELMNFFEGVTRCIIIDAVASPKKPGTIVKIEKEHIIDSLNQKMSVHEIGIVDLLNSLELLGIAPPDITLIGMVPYRVEFGYGISPECAKKMPTLIEAILEEIFNDTQSTQFFDAASKGS